MRAIYGDIYKDLRAKIAQGDYPYQSFLPPESELVRTYSCSHNTIRRALAMLAEEGSVQPIHGKGVRVIRRPPSRAQFTFGGIESFTESAAAAGISPQTEVRVFEQVLADGGVVDLGGFAEGTPLWHIERIRSIDGQRLIRDINYFSVEHVPALTREIAAGSIYRYLEEELGLVVAVGNRVLTVERATPEDRATLDMDEYNSLAVITGQIYTRDGIHIESTQSRHRQDYFSFAYTARRGR